jgi:hypothetical protein
LAILSIIGLKVPAPVATPTSCISANTSALALEAARQALALRRAANFIPYPSAGATASEGMAPHPSRRRKTIIEGAKIGRISQATKIAQSVRDTRGV